MLALKKKLIRSLGSDGFIFTINTTLGAGSTFQLPLPSGETYNFDVFWGDGNSDTITVYNQTETLHTYSSSGTYQISISGKCGGWSFINGGDRLKMISVDNWGDVGFDNLVAAFYGCSNLTTIDGGQLTYNGTLLSSFARSCTSLTTFNIDNWATPNLDAVSNFINGCTSLTSIDLTGLNVSGCRFFISFMQGCTLLSTVNISNWVVDSATSIESFAYDCSSLTSLDVGSWDVSGVSSIANFCRGCGLLTSLDVSSWDVSGVSNMSRFAFSCGSIVTLDTSSWDTSSITNCANAFQSMTNLTSSFDAVKWWDRAVPITTYTNCFANSTNISNYASIPNDWKGL